MQSLIQIRPYTLELTGLWELHKTRLRLKDGAMPKTQSAGEAVSAGEGAMGSIQGS